MAYPREVENLRVYHNATAPVPSHRQPSVWSGAQDHHKAVDMDIMVHIGAHRTSNQSLQAYLEAKSTDLAADGLEVWGPDTLRKGLCNGLVQGRAPAFRKDLAKRARGRIRMRLNGAKTRGVKTLLVTEQNMMGSIRGNVRARALYPAIGENMARFDWAFDGAIKRIILTIRSHDLWWSSALAYAVQRGAGLPGDMDLDMIARSMRGWRDIITDLSCAVPHAEILVLPFEVFAGRAPTVLECTTGHKTTGTFKPEWLNRAPDLGALRRSMLVRGELNSGLPLGVGRWQPFTKTQQAMLRELYADDLFWLASGADGLATLTEDPLRQNRHPSLAGQGPHLLRGHDDDGKIQHLARPG